MARHQGSNDPADLAEGIYAAGPEALTSYNTTTTDYATQFGIFVHDEDKRIKKTTGATETYTLDAAYTPEGMLKNLVAQVKKLKQDYLNNLTSNADVSRECIQGICEPDVWHNASSDR